MAAFSGLQGRVRQSAGTNVWGMREWTLNVSLNTVESSEFGDTWEEAIPGIKSASGSFSGIFNDQNEIGFNTMNDALLNGVEVELQLYFDFDNSYYWDINPALITDIAPQMNHNGILEHSFSFTSNGDITLVNS